MENADTISRTRISRSTAAHVREATRTQELYLGVVCGVDMYGVDLKILFEHAVCKDVEKDLLKLT